MPNTIRLSRSLEAEGPAGGPLEMSSSMRKPSRSLGPRFAFVVAITGLVLCAACADAQRSTAIDMVEDLRPATVDGELYVATSADGSCDTDCPAPTASWGWLVECADIDSAVASLTDEFRARGFSMDGGGSFTQSVDGVDLTMDVFTYTDASEGPWPTEEPFVSAPGDLADRCAVFVLAMAS